MSAWEERMRQECRPLAVELAQLNLVHNLLLSNVHPPVCGKPGHGYKAQARLQKDVNVIERSLECISRTISNWVSDNGNASLPVAGQRKAIFDAVYGEVTTPIEEEENDVLEAA